MAAHFLKNNATEGCDCIDRKVDSCAYPMIRIEGTVYLRKTDSSEEKRCHDCNVLYEDGNVHHLGCDSEECPRCENQLIGCQCHLEELISDEKSMEIKYSDPEWQRP